MMAMMRTMRGRKAVTMAMMRTMRGSTVQAVKVLEAAARVSNSSSSADTSVSNRDFSSCTVTSLSLTERRLAILLSASSRDCSKAEVEEFDCSKMEREDEDSKREEEEVEAGRLQLVLSASSRGCRAGASSVTSSLLAYLAFSCAFSASNTLSR